MFKVCKFDNVYVAAVAIVVIAVTVVVIIVIIVVVDSVILSAIIIVCLIRWMFQLGSDQSAGQVWISSVGHSGRGTNSFSTFKNNVRDFKSL